VNALRERYDQLMIQFKLAQGNITRYEGKVRLLYEEWRAKNEAILKLEAVVTSLRAVLAQKDSVSQTYLAQMMDLQVQLQSRGTLVGKWQADYKALQLAFQEKEALILRLQADIKALTEEIAVLRANVVTLRSQDEDVARLQALLNEKNGLIDRYQLEVGTLQSQIKQILNFQVVQDCTKFGDCLECSATACTKCSVGTTLKGAICAKPCGSNEVQAANG
jgi:chromosome segregation ATPase